MKSSHEGMSGRSPNPQTDNSGLTQQYCWVTVAGVCLYLETRDKKNICRGVLMKPDGKIVASSNSNAKVYI